MQKEHILTFRIYHEDTDMLGMVFNANHIKFIERGRSEWLLAQGIDQKLLLDNGTLFVLRSIHLDYLKPIRFHDEIEVVTMVDVIKKVSMDFNSSIRMKNNHDIVFCKAKSQIVCVNKDMKPQALPKEIAGI